MASWQDLIQFIIDGELVNAANTNAAPLALAGNVSYLKEILQEAFAGQTLYAREQTVDAAVNVGQAVYYNGRTQQFELAKAAVYSDPLTGTLIPACSSFVWGLVARKINTTKADILLHGFADLDLTNAVTGTPTSGLYFLSGNQPGMLLQQQPPVSVPVCLVAGEGCKPGTTQVYVNPVLKDLLDGHQHYKFSLICAPAGDTVPGSPHVITNADDAVEGWLPADDASFNGKAPAGAVFGYNVAASAFANLWPPIPVQGAYLEWDKGSEAGGLGVGVPLGPGGLAIVDSNGIWWMSADDPPWPAELNTAYPASFSFSVDSSPLEMAMRLTLWFTKPTFMNDQSCVLSLTPRPDSGLATYCHDTNTPANTGNLDIDLDLGLLQGVTNLPGPVVMKQLAGKLINSGPVVESIKAGSSNVLLAGGAPHTTIAGAFTGNLQIAVQDTLNGFEMPVETVRLAGAHEAFPFDILGLAFDAGVTSTIYGRIGVRNWPTLPAGTQMILRFWVLARVAGSIPADAFSVQVLNIPMPTDDLTPQDLPTTYSAVDMDCEVDSVAADQYVLMETAPFDVATGDTIMFQVTRSATDEYDGELDLVRKTGVLVVPGD